MPNQIHFTTLSEAWKREGYLRPPAGSSYSKTELNRLGHMLRQMRTPYKLYFSDIRLFYDDSNEPSVTGSATQPKGVLLPYFKESEAYKREQDEVERTLLGLFFLSSHYWEAIALDEIKLMIQGEDRCLSHNFSDIFFYYLYEEMRGIKSLSVKGVPLPANPQHFLEILRYNRNLTALGCQFRTDQMLYFSELIEEIAEHPCLQTVDLGHTVLDRQGYQALASLLDKNYRLKKIDLLVPSDPVLKIAHKVLMKRLDQSPAKRFKKEQLSQGKLLTLAEKNLLSKSYVAPLLKRPSHLPAITWSMSERQAILATWPAIYQTHLMYLDVDWSYTQLDIHQRLETDKSVTVGAYLLAKAAESKSEEVICYLLEIGADPLEKLDVDLVKGLPGKSLLTRALFDKNQVNWSQAVITYVKKGFTALASPLSRLIPYFSVNQKIDETYRHLMSYLDQVDKRNQLSALVRWITSLSSRLDERKAELENAFKKMVDLINAGTEYRDVSDTVFNRMCCIVNEIETDVKKARRGLRGRSEFNDKMGKLCFELEKVILGWKEKLKEEAIEKRVRQEESGRIKHLEEENSQLREVVQTKDTELATKDTELAELRVQVCVLGEKIQALGEERQTQAVQVQAENKGLRQAMEVQKEQMEVQKGQIAQLFQLVKGYLPRQERVAGEEQHRFFQP